MPRFTRSHWPVTMMRAGWGFWRLGTWRGSPLLRSAICRRGAPDVLTAPFEALGLNEPQGWDFVVTARATALGEFRSGFRRHTLSDSRLGAPRVSLEGCGAANICKAGKVSFYSNRKGHV